MHYTSVGISSTLARVGTSCVCSQRLLTEEISVFPSACLTVRVLTACGGVCGDSLLLRGINTPRPGNPSPRGCNGPGRHAAEVWVAGAARRGGETHPACLFPMREPGAQGHCLCSNGIPAPVPEPRNLHKNLESARRSIYSQRNTPAWHRQSRHSRPLWLIVIFA